MSNIFEDSMIGSFERNLDENMKGEVSRANLKQKGNREYNISRRERNNKTAAKNPAKRNSIGREI